MRSLGLHFDKAYCQNLVAFTLIPLCVIRMITHTRDQWFYPNSDEKLVVLYSMSNFHCHAKQNRKHIKVSKSMKTYENVKFKFNKLKMNDPVTELQDVKE